MIIKNSILTVLLILMILSCKKQEFIYQGKAYVQFSEKERSFSLENNKTKMSFEINTIAVNQHEDITCEILVDEEKSNIVEGLHFVIKNKISVISKGKFISKNSIIFNYDDFIDCENPILILKLKKRNTPIGDYKQLTININRKDWMKDFPGKFKITYLYKNKIQNAVADITEINKIIDEENNVSYRLTLIGLPVWTFSSGPKLLPKEYYISFNKYSANKIELQLSNETLATANEYRSWLMSFDYGNLSISTNKNSNLDNKNYSFILNYDISLGNKTRVFENIKFTKIIDKQ